MVFSERLACAECGISFPEVSPRMFSFNNPYGACPECGGIGTRWEIDPERLVPNPARSLQAGALAPWAGRESTYFRQTLAALAKRYKFSLDEPWSKLRKSVRDVILFGDKDGGFEGVVKVLDRRYRETQSEDARVGGRGVHGRAAVSGVRRLAPAAGVARAQDRRPLDRRRRALHHQGRLGVLRVARADRARGRRSRAASSRRSASGSAS